MFGGILVGFLEILESYVVIDNSRVQKIRERIFIENPLLTNQEKSRRLIQKIHSIIDDDLEGIEAIHARKIRTIVLHRSVKNNSILVTYSDIVHSIAELNLSLEETIESIKSWYDLHLRGSQISLIQLIDYIKAEQQYLLETMVIEEPVVVEEVNIEEADSEVNDEVIELNDIEIPGEDQFQQKKKVDLLVITGIASLILFFITGVSTDNAGDLEPIESESYQGVSFLEAQELFEINTVEQGYFNESILFHSALEADGVPFYLTYHSIDKIALQNYLRSRNSILAESPYYEGILKVAKEYDLHPLLLFAITGQEQGYVNKDNPNHLKIANNPFNVYNSWRKYNTDIEDSTAIAAGTVITILRKRPAGENPYKWINTRYAEDKNWARGVEMIFNFLMQYQL